MDFAKRSPLVLSRAARFARLKCEVGAEDFLEGGFFGGYIVSFCYFVQHLRVSYPLTERLEPRGSVPLQPPDLLLRRPPLGHKRPLPLNVSVALYVLLHIEVGQAARFLVYTGDCGSQFADSPLRHLSGLSLVLVGESKH